MATKTSAERHVEQLTEIVSDLEKKLAHDKQACPEKVASVEARLIHFRAELANATAPQTEPK